MTGATTKVVVVPLPCPEQPVLGARVLGDGRFAAVVAGQRGSPLRLSLISTREQKRLGAWSYSGGQHAFDGFDMLPSGTLILRDGDTGALRGITTDGRIAFAVASDATGLVGSATVRALPTGRWLASNREEGVALLDDTGRVLLASDSTIRNWAVSADGERLAVRRFDTARQASEVTIHDRDGKKLPSRIPADSFEAMHYAPNHTSILVRPRHRCSLSLLDGNTGASQATFGEAAGCGHAIGQFGFGKDGEVVFERGTTFEVWSLSANRPVLIAGTTYADGSPPQPTRQCVFDAQSMPCPTVAKHSVGYVQFGDRARYAVIGGSPRPFGDIKPEWGMVDYDRDGFALASDGARLLVVRSDSHSTEVQTWDTGRRELVASVPIPTLEYSARFTVSPSGAYVFLQAGWRVRFRLKGMRDEGVLFDALNGARVTALEWGEAFIGFRDDNALLTLPCRR